LAEGAKAVAEGASAVGDVVEEGYKASAGGIILGSLLKLFKLGEKAAALTEIADVTAKGARHANIFARVTASQFKANGTYLGASSSQCWG
jgi:hypothetical protein